MKKIGVYKITSPSGRIYIGQSVDLDKRFNEYLKLRNCKYQIKLYNSFLKYGVENHLFEVIKECKIELLNELERYWQDFYNVLEKGLNCKLTNTYSKSGFLSIDTRIKMSISGKHKNKGKRASEETKLKQSLSKKGITPHNKGKNTFYKHKCKICDSEFQTRIRTSKICSLDCRDENNRICNAKRKRKT